MIQLKFKSKFFIYYNVKLVSDIRFRKYKIPSSIVYKMLIVNASSDETLFIDDDFEPIYFIIKKYIHDENDITFYLYYENISIPSDLEIVLNHFRYQPGYSGYKSAKNNYEQLLNEVY